MKSREELHKEINLLKEEIVLLRRIALQHSVVLDKYEGVLDFSVILNGSELQIEYHDFLRQRRQK